MAKITVLVVDDQADIRLLVRTLINVANKGLVVEHEASSGEEALAYLDGCDATVVVLDQMMPGMTGLETARAMLDRRPNQRILLFSAYLDDELTREAKDVGILACLDKTDVTRVATAVRAVAAA